MVDDSKDALEVWEAMVDGSWSLIQWFDTGTRRYILLRRNPPEVREARRFSEQERNVASRAALGESNKLIACRLGMSPNRVSSALRSTLRKLGFRTKAQLVYCVRGLGLPVANEATAGSEAPRAAA